jgi:hypothetical protein
MRSTEIQDEIAAFEELPRKLTDLVTHLIGWDTLPALPRIPEAENSTRARFKTQPRARIARLHC